MHGLSTRLTISVASLALLLFAFFGTLFLSGPISFFYRSAAGLEAVRAIASAAARSAAAGFLVSALIIVFSTELKSAGIGRKLVSVIPGFTLGLLLADVGLNLANIGTAETVFDVPIPVQINFATAWLARSALLCALALSVAAARVDLAVWAPHVVLATLSMTGTLAAISLYSRHRARFRRKTGSNGSTVSFNRIWRVLSRHQSLSASS